MHKSFFLHSQARLITFPIIMNSSKDSSSRKCINKTLCIQKPHLLFPIIVSSTRDRGWCGKLSVSKWATVSHTARQMPSLLKKDTSYLFSPSLLHHCCHTTCFEDTQGWICRLVCGNTRKLYKRSRYLTLWWFFSYFFFTLFCLPSNFTTWRQKIISYSLLMFLYSVLN